MNKKNFVKIVNNIELKKYLLFVKFLSMAFIFSFFKFLISNKVYLLKKPYLLL